ncbi:MAG: hypothetical protein NVSMB52_18170 [Chloroflexota bacterium]
MRSILAAAVCATLAVTAVAPVQAASVNASRSPAGQIQVSTNWNQHDCAVYVVSTLNLVRTKTGRPISTVLEKRLGVRRYNVYSDLAVSDLYFIEFVKKDGTVVGAVAYRMGWQKPMSVTDSAGNLRMRRALDSIVENYRVDRKALAGSFTSTLPA